MLRSLRHISTDSTGWTKKLEKTPDETYVFLWIIVHIINVDISYYVLGKRAEWDRKIEGLRHDMFMEWRNTTKSISNIFHVYLMKGMQKCARNLILTMAFWGQTKTGEKVLPDGLDWLCYLAGSWKSHVGCLISCMFLHQVDMKIVVKCWK